MYTVHAMIVCCYVIYCTTCYAVVSWYLVHTCICDLFSILEQLQQQQVSQQSSPSPGHPKPINLKSILSKLPISLDWKVNELAVHLQLDRRAKYDQM